MKTIYLDENYMCHLEDAQGRTAVETDVFDGTANSAIPYYRFIPQGDTWTDEKGRVFHGIFIQATDSKAIDFATQTETAEQLAENIALATSYLDDEQAETVTALYPYWDVDIAYEVGDRRQYDGLLYRCVQAHTSQADWTPDVTPALWVRTWTDPFPEWVQPTGAHDAYNKGDKVSHLGKHWVSDIDANVYEPSVYGWDEVTDE